jgi:hypothetical protein
LNIGPVSYSNNKNQANVNFSRYNDTMTVIFLLKTVLLSFQIVCNKIAAFILVPFKISLDMVHFYIKIEIRVIESLTQKRKGGGDIVILTVFHNNFFTYSKINVSHTCTFSVG